MLPLISTLLPRRRRASNPPFPSFLNSKGPPCTCIDPDEPLESPVIESSANTFNTIASQQNLDTTLSPNESGASLFSAASTASSAISDDILNNPQKLSQLPRDQIPTDDNGVPVNAPPVPVGGDGDPIMLPNEKLLQRFPERRSVLKLSELRVQHAKLNCSRCNPDSNDVFHKGESVADKIREYNFDYLTAGSQPGVLYVTTERIIFVPLSEMKIGFSIPIEDITTMKVLESDTIKDSWFFVCYVGSFVSTMPFGSKAPAKAFMNLIANLHFEHKIRQNLPPRYTGRQSIGGSLTQETPWEVEDSRLPSYDESEGALKQYMVNEGLIHEDHPLNRNDENLGSLIALASAPPRDRIDREQSSQQLAELSSRILSGAL
ncbi:hypothetical protein TRVA0_005S00540 [Trichomonascus vanleenenianus]|uniref:uncharacterized protein n=1 Tax=Trichomonascus vanleenenianus TaxID=2268995 RepID=UPI003EC9E08C